jgi:Fic family protein
MAERPDKRPGRLKKKSNQAGSTIFVEPEKVEGTLVQGFELYKKLSAGMLRALFMHFLVAECHPFDDGNGRLARIMMNAELVDAGLHKIIVPSVCRDNYLNGMRLASRNQRFRTNVKVLHQLHQYTASIDWMDYADVRQTLEQDAADQDPDDGLMVFNRRLRDFAGDYQAG